MKNFLAKMLVGDFSNTANQATRQQFVRNFKNTFGIQDDISISDIQAGTREVEFKPGTLSPADVEKGDKYAEQFRYEMDVQKKIAEEEVILTSDPDKLLSALERKQDAEIRYADMVKEDAIITARYGNLNTKMREVASNERTESVFEAVPLSTNQDILDPIQKALREGNFMTKEGMEGIKQNVEAGLGQYAGYSRAGETSGSTFTRFITGMDQDPTALKTIGGLATLGAMGGLANVMTGGDFTTGAAVTAGAASILRGGGKLFNQSLMSFEENTMEAILKGSKSSGVPLKEGRTARLKQMQSLEFTDVNKASKKMRDDLINRKSGGNINTRALTISGGMLSGVAFTGRSDKRDYRRGFNKHRGNRI